MNHAAFRPQFKHSALLFILVLSLQNVAIGAENDVARNLARCTAIEGGIEMLACYDSVAKDVVGDLKPAVSAPTQGVGKWHVRVSKNVLDDTDQVSLSLDADEPYSDINMIIRCKSNQTDLYINWNDYLGDDSVGDDQKFVIVRVGNSKAQEQRWDISTDSKATFAPSSPIPLIKATMKVDHVIFQTTPYNESPKTVQFDVIGLAGAIVPLAKTCRWSVD